MRRIRPLLAVLLLLSAAVVATAQTVRIQDGTSPNLATVNAVGALSVIGASAASCTLTAVISQATGTKVIAGVAGKRILLCVLLVMTATSQNISVVEGTGAVCATNTAGVVGGTSPSVPLTASGGFALTAASPFMQTQTLGTDLCILQASTGGVSGTIAFQQQ